MARLTCLRDSPPMSTMIVFLDRAPVPEVRVGLGAGVRRNTGVLKARLKKFKQRIPHFQALRRVGVDTARVVRAGGTAAMTHGEASSGVSPSMLLAQRRAATAAGAPKGGLGGQELEVAAMILDGSKTGKADPAFPAHMDVAHHWA